MANVQDFTFTTHAIDRYVQRINPEASYTDAKSQLVQELDSVRKQKQNTRSGCNRWLLPRLGCVLITRREEGTNIVLTIISRDMEQDGELTDAEIYQEWADEFEENRHLYEPRTSSLEWQDIITRVTSLEKKRLQLRAQELSAKKDVKKEQKVSHYKIERDQLKAQLKSLKKENKNQKRRIKDQDLHTAKLKAYIQKRALEGDMEACYLLGNQRITAQG